MQQILFIHGGESFSKYESYLERLKNKQLDYESLKYAPRWREWIAQQAVDCDVLLPTMPNGFYAVYDEWVIYFEKILPMLTDGVTLVGHSLGGMFLAKYFHTHKLEEKVHRIVLVAARYGETKTAALLWHQPKGSRIAHGKFICFTVRTTLSYPMLIWQSLNMTSLARLFTALRAVVISLTQPFQRCLSL